MRKRTIYEFEQVCQDAVNVWTDGEHIGTLLHVNSHWEAYDEDGEHVLDEGNNGARFRSREEAAETLAVLRQE